VATPLTIVRDAKDFLSAGGSANRLEDSPLQQPRSRVRLEDSPTSHPRHKMLMQLRRLPFEDSPTSHPRHKMLRQLRRLPFEDADMDMPSRLPPLNTENFRPPGTISASAPPSRGVIDKSRGLGPTTRMSSPPKTDPPRQRKSKKSIGKCSPTLHAPAVPDSPIPLPPHFLKDPLLKEVLSDCGIQPHTAPEPWQESSLTSLGSMSPVPSGGASLATAPSLSARPKDDVYVRQGCMYSGGNDPEDLDRSVDDGFFVTWLDPKEALLVEKGRNAEVGLPIQPVPVVDMQNEFLHDNAECDDWDDMSCMSGKVIGCCPASGHFRVSPCSSVASSSMSTSFPHSIVHSDGPDDVDLGAGAVQGSCFTWTRGELIGRGSLGSVWKVFNRKTGQLMAAKEVMLDHKNDSEKFRAALQNEIDLCTNLQHPNIVTYLGNDFVNGKLYIYLEYMPGGSIAQVLAQFGPLDEPVVARYMGNMLQGLNFLHTLDPPVLHRDIKGANILVGLDRMVKLADFGCSKRSNGTMVQTLRGSVPWMAPEVMREAEYGRKADIWSIGCVVIEMITAAAPWGRFDNFLAAMVRIAMSDETPPVPANVSNLCHSVIDICTRRTPEERPSASQLLRHDFVAVGCQTSTSESWEA